MKNEFQIKRIEEFIDSLEYSEVDDGQQAIVLNSDINVVGGASNNSCRNEGSDSCKLSNKNCINYGSCGTNSGSGCANIGGAGKPGVQ